MLPVQLKIDPAAAIGSIDRRLFGSFVEHLGRCVYDGLYEPGHPAADEDGFRTDVLELVRELGVSAIRYPGGNFVSGYRWEDGVGDRARRPRRLDLAWHSLETNQVGLDEFRRWTRKAGSELVYALNLGTRGVQEAVDVLEYANVPHGSRLSDERVANGAIEPHDIRMWCLGNEMDGPWQLGHTTAEAYGRLAAQTARAMRQVDPALELVVCGSSGSQMPTFGEWERTVLRETYDEIDFISCHAYYEPADGDYASFLASAVDMDRFIESVIEIADEVRRERGSERAIAISFDEWNVWYYAVGAVDAVAAYDDTSREATVFLVNRSLDEQAEVVIDAAALGDFRLQAVTLHDDDMHAANTRAEPERVAPRTNGSARIENGAVRVVLPPVSWTAVTLSP